MDEWQVEMREIKARLADLRAKRGDEVIIAELEAQLRILQSFYEVAWEVFEAGEADREVRAGLGRTGMGPWTFENVYSFIYERAMEIEPGRRELSSLIPELDYLGMLRAS
jgi:hypothetical protein